MRTRQKQKPIRLDEAIALVHDALRPIERKERVVLKDAGGRVLACDVTAAIDVPPFDRAAMDGYAVRAGDTVGASSATPVVLRRTEEVFTGDAPRGSVSVRECAGVATGAPMPPGADAVVMVEKVREDGDFVQVFTTAAAGQNVGIRAADIRAGQRFLCAGDVLKPANIGALAAVGLSHVEVYARPNVAIISTGNEIVEPGRPLEASQIYDVNTYTLSTLVSDHGGVPRIGQTIRDDLHDLSRGIAACLDCDLLVFSGGSSVGARDYILEAVAARGTILFDSVAVKPGKPTGFGLIDGTPIFVMPGYPGACLINGYVLLAPALRRIARLPGRPLRVSVPLARRVESRIGRHHFCAVRVEDGVAVPTSRRAGDITGLSDAHGYVEIAADLDGLDGGTMVDVTLF